MKTLMFIVLAIGLVSVAEAQDISQNEVPSVVLNEFQSKYPKATDVEWNLSSDLYQVEFEVDRKDHDLWIDKSGAIKKQKIDIPQAQLPDVIKQKIGSEFKGYQIDDIDRIEEDGKVSFLVDLDGKVDDREVLFTEDGKIQSNIVD